MNMASGQYIVVLDDDVSLPDPSLLARAVERAQQTPRLGAIGFRQLTPDGKVHYMQPATGNEVCQASPFLWLRVSRCAATPSERRTILRGARIVPTRKSSWVSA